MNSKNEKNDKYRDFWTDDEQVFFTGGVGYGLTPRLQIIPLGNESDILGILKAGKVPDYIDPLQHQVLERIIEYRKGVLTDARKAEIKKPGTIRSRSTGDVKRRTATIRQTKARKRLPIYKA